MTQQFGDQSAPESRRSTPEVARDEAADVARHAADRGGDVAGTVGEQAGRVASETKQQARNLFHESREQLTGQARQGQRRAADGLHALGDQMRQMSEKTEDQGIASEVARQVADRAHGVASWLERREPGDLVDEVRRFARRKPGVFLVGAALAGVAVGRLTRGAIAAQSDDSDDRGTTGTPTAAGPYGARTPDVPGYAAAPEVPGYPASPEAPGYPAAPAARPSVAETPGYSMPPAQATPPAPPAPGTWDPRTGPVTR